MRRYLTVLAYSFMLFAAGCIPGMAAAAFVGKYVLYFLGLAMACALPIVLLVVLLDTVKACCQKGFSESKSLLKLSAGMVILVACVWGAILTFLK